MPGSSNVSAGQSAVMSIAIEDFCFAPIVVKSSRNGSAMTRGEPHDTLPAGPFTVKAIVDERKNVVTERSLSFAIVSVTDTSTPRATSVASVVWIERGGV